MNTGVPPTPLKARTGEFTPPGITSCAREKSAVDFVKEFDEIMLIGGGELFKQYLPKADKLYLTQIQADIDGDTFFPEINWSEWNIEFEEYRQADEDNPYDCRSLILQRKKNKLKA